LAPLVARPDLAVLPTATRDALSKVAARFPVALLSGRDREDVAARVGLPGLVYAGSHGFDIAGPGLRHEVGEGIPEQIESAAASLRQALAGIPGILIEPKRFALSIHYRQTPADRRQEIERVVEAVAAQHPRLKRALGKKLFELRPDLDWDKGKALLWVLQEMGLTGPGALPIYLGDDLTDEDAFQAIAEVGGIGIVVQEEDIPGETAAGYSLRDPGEVRELLERLLKLTRHSHPPPPRR